MPRVRRNRAVVLLLVTLGSGPWAFACLPRGHGDAPGQADGDVDPAHAFDPCGAAWMTSGPDGRTAVRVRCRFLDLEPAQYRPGETFLRQLALGRGTGPVSDADLRATAEYRSYMDPRNVWQWRDRVTEAEALAACRAMLADLRAGRAVPWDTAARAYLARVRQASRSRAAPGPSAAEAAKPRAPPDPASRARGPGEGGPGSGTEPEIDGVRVVVETGYILPGLRASHDPDDHRLAEILARVLDRTERHMAAVSVVLSGASTVVIAGVVLGGQVYRVVITTGGVAIGDLDLARKLADPLFDQLARDLRDLDDLSEEARRRLGDGAPRPGDEASRLALEQQIEYRRLIDRPSSWLGPDELARIDDLHRHAGLADPTDPRSAAHKARRWAEYRARHGEWPFERWSRTYDQNIDRASQAHARADAYYRELGWGEREVRVDLKDGRRRVLDIGDRENKRGVEVKSGYVTFDASVADQVIRDAALIARDNWSIQWYVDGRCSQPLREALRGVGIDLIETQPHVPIRELRR